MAVRVPAVVGVDAGTTSAKAVVVTPEGAAVGFGTSDDIATSSSADGASEQDPSAITGAMAEATARALAGCGEDVAIEAVCIAAQSGSVVPVGVADQRFAARTWMDTRGQAAVDSWTEDQRSTIRLVSGWMPSAGNGLSTIAAMQEGQTSGVRRWASVDDHLLHELTGDWVTNPSNAAGMQLMDVRSRTWSSELCGLVGLEPQQLATMGESGEIAGDLGTAGVGFGLPGKAVAVIGGHDQACAALGLGALHEGDTVLSGGTAWVLSVLSPAVPIAALAPSYNLSPHVVNGQWSTSAFIGPLGALIAAHLPIQDRHPDSGSGQREAPRLALNAPYFVVDTAGGEGSHWGALVDAGGRPFAADADATLRAVFEACAYRIYTAIAAAPLQAEDRPLLFVGGGTRDRELCQLLADGTGREVTVHAEASWPALGAARLAARALDWEDITAMPSRKPERFAPRPATSEILTERFAIHRQLESGDLS